MSKQRARCLCTRGCSVSVPVCGTCRRYTGTVNPRLWADVIGLLIETLQDSFSYNALAGFQLDHYSHASLHTRPKRKQDNIIIIIVIVIIIIVIIIILR